ncbi:ER membrane complex subunit 6 [Quaeritorhiza haematococci]|nr:ER membrane complex subunit 6 [Quaeritorhiza haematococci]
MSSPLTKPPVAYSLPSIRHNTKTITYTRSSLAAVAGAAAGILGLQGWIYGFLFYVFSSLLMSSLVWGLGAGGKPERYFASWRGVWVDEVGGNLFSYMLFWTLAYGLVHVYD